MEAQEESQGNSGEEGLESPMEDATGENQEAQGEGDKELPAGVKERIWRQERKHKREMREMSAKVESLQSHLNSTQTRNQPESYENQPQSDDVDEQIHKAVSYALKHKELSERKAKEDAKHDESMQNLYQQHKKLHEHLDDMSEKYEDFEDVVRDERRTFTQAMHDVALMLPQKGAGSAGEVLYKLGKNPSELKRITQLHPLDQASELIKLSHALIGGEEAGKSSPSRPLGHIKSTPVSSSRTINDKTSISELRRRQRERDWK